MKKVDLNFEIKGGNDGTGKPMISKANESLANWLEMAPITEEVKICQYFNWALQLKATGTLDLSEADILELKKFVTSHLTVVVFFKQPILNALNNVIKEKKK